MLDKLAVYWLILIVSVLMIWVLYLFILGGPVVWTFYGIMIPTCLALWRILK